MLILILFLWFFIGSWIGLSFSDLIDQGDFDDGKIKGKYFTKRGRLERSCNFALLMLNWPLVILVMVVGFSGFLLFVIIWEWKTGKNWVKEHPLNTNLFDEES